MNLKALRVLCGIMEEGTLTEAAARMHLSQSAASRLLSLLEEELGVDLFLRERRSLVPTPRAEMMYVEAQRILAQVDALPDLVSDDGRAATLHILCQPRLVAGLVVPAIADFARSWPRTSVRLETASRRELDRRVNAGRHDLAVATLPLAVEGMVLDVLGSVRLSILLPADHPKAGTSPLDIVDLEATPYIALDATTVIRHRIDDALARSGVVLRPAHETSTGSAAYRLVAQGLGFTFADRVALDPGLEGSTRLVPWNQEVTVEVGVFRADRRSPEIDAFGEVLRAVFNRCAT